jgi:hypothetical protein
VVRQAVRFVRWLGGLRAAMPLLFWSLLVSSALVLIALFVWALLSVSRSFTVGGRFGSRREAEEQARQRLRLSATYRDEARRAAERGEYTEAIRFLFLSLLYRFDESGQVGLPKARTNREYLALLDNQRPVQEQLRVFVDTLDEDWYGQHPSPREQYERCQALYGRLAGA